MIVSDDASIDERVVVPYLLDITLCALDDLDHEGAGIVGRASCWCSAAGSDGGRDTCWNWVGCNHGHKGERSECATHFQRKLDDMLRWYMQ